MNHWLNQHIQPLRMVLGRMRQNLLGTILMCCVMGVTLSLPAILFTIVDNLGQVAGGVESKPQLSLFLKLDASNSTKEAIGEQLKKHPELAQVDSNWIKRLDTVLKLGKKAIFVLVTLLGFALVAVIGNTIRLQIMTQLEEIEVSKLIGATNQFIRRPFLYAGTLYGLGGGLAAWLIVLAVVQLFNTSVTKIADLYASQFRLSMPNASITIAMLLSAVALGWLGSFVAVNRSLAKIEKL